MPKLSKDEVYTVSQVLIPLYQQVLGLARWQIGLLSDRDLPHENAARTTWDVANHTVQIQINTTDYDWSLEREPGVLNLQETLAHELIHLWFGEAGVYNQLGWLGEGGFVDEKTLNVVDKVLEHTIDFIASCMVYHGALKEIDGFVGECCGKHVFCNNGIPSGHKEEGRVDCEPGKSGAVECPGNFDGGLGPDTIEPASASVGDKGVD